MVVHPDVKVRFYRTEKGGKIYLFTMLGERPEKQFHARGSERAERKDRSNNAIDHQNDGKTTVQDGIVRNICPKADLYLLHDRFVCRQVSKRSISSR